MLTTQYLDEAERLADDIVVIDHGRIIAQGDAPTLKRRVGGTTVHAVLGDASQLDAAAQHLRTITGTDVAVDSTTRSLSAPTRDGVTTIARFANVLADNAIVADDLALRQPSLDEVFLTLTGATATNNSHPDDNEELTP